MWMDKKVIFFIQSVAKLYIKLNYLLNSLNYYIKPKCFVKYIHEVKINYGTYIQILLKLVYALT